MEYSTALLVAAHTAVRDHIQAGTANMAAFRVYSAADTLLATLPLDAADVGSVDAETGQLILTPAPSGATAVADGEADHADLIGNDGDVMLTDMPVVAGTSAMPGHLVLTGTIIAAGGEVRLVSATIG